LRESELTKLLGWLGYRVYRHEINERAKTLKLWIRRKRENRKLACSGCGRKLEMAHDVSEWEVRSADHGMRCRAHNIVFAFDAGADIYAAARMH